MSTTTRTEHGTLFTAEMVRAILDGRKGQTRRVVTSRNSLLDGHKGVAGWVWGELDWTDAYVDGGPSPAGNAGPYLKVGRPSMDSRHRIYPKVWIGDLLWVREAWGFRSRTYEKEDGSGLNFVRVAYKADARDPAQRVIETDEITLAVSWEDYRSAGDELRREVGLCGGGHWRPSIHMPKWACRIWLEVTKVRVQHVQAISQHDIEREGLPAGTECLGFSALWDSINEKRGYGWRINPWVWVYEFKQVEREAA